jgi:hypothetical protein
MTDTETRLRDYLHSKAATIADDPPPLALPPRPHRTWPIAVAAAAIAAILVIAIPLAIHLSGTDKTEKPATTPSPTAPLSKELRVPYLLSDGKTDTLHDGSQTVRTSSLALPPNGRVLGGWVATTGKVGGPFQNGVLHPDGKFQPIGPPNASYPTKSPDGSKIAVAQPLGKGRTRVLVFDIATKKEIASVTLPHKTTVLWAWNQSGIWLGEDYKVGAQPMLWQPGQGQPVQLTIPGFDLGLVGAPNTDKVVVTTRSDKSWCMKVGSVRGSGLAIDGQYCGTGGTVYPVLSPDGTTLIATMEGLSINVTTGKVTKLRMPYSMFAIPTPIFEDNTHIAVVPLPGLDQKPPTGTGVKPLGRGRQAFRCDVISGACDLLFATPTGVRATLLNP